MFGGWGIYKDGVMFALIAVRSALPQGRRRQSAGVRGRRPAEFTYSGKGKPIGMSYREAPREGFDDPEILCAWAREAYAAALRAKKPKRK